MTKSEQTTTETPAPETAPGAEAAIAAIPAPPASEPAAGGNAEAAKYRTRLRETEAERDRLAGIVTGFRTTEVERTVAALSDTLGDPHDLWTDGVTLDDLLDDDGTVDAGKVEAAVAGVIERHPAWAKQEPPFPDLGQGVRGEIASASPSIGEAVRNAVRGR